MRVTAALLARYAEVDSGFINIVGGGVDVFGVHLLPVEFSQPFAMQLRFAEAEAEAEAEFQIGMAILGPDLQEVGLPTEFPIVPTLAEFHAEGWEGVFYVAGTVGLYAKQAGAHSIAIRVDGAESGSIPFQVVVLEADE